MKEKFLEAINKTLKVRVTFDSKEKGVITRTCIPFDFGPSQKIDAIDKTEKYHLLDLDSPDGPHNLPLNVEQVLSMEILNESFDPADYVKWTPRWIYKRNWGMYS